MRLHWLTCLGILLIGGQAALAQFPRPANPYFDPYDEPALHPYPGPLEDYNTPSYPESRIADDNGVGDDDWYDRGDLEPDYGYGFGYRDYGYGYGHFDADGEYDYGYGYDFGVGPDEYGYDYDGDDYGYYYDYPLDQWRYYRTPNRELGGEPAHYNWRGRYDDPGERGLLDF